MKKLFLLLLLVSSFTFSQDKSSYDELLEKNAFNSMYPEFMAEEAAEYFDEFKLLLSLLL